ncbi:hypothetical protein WME73_49875 [Sorangium sp. So ce302]
MGSNETAAPVSVHSTVVWRRTSTAHANECTQPKPRPTSRSRALVL